MDAVITTEINSEEWPDISTLIAQAIPNALISKLGKAVGAAFYGKIVEQDCSCGYVAKDESGNIVGVIIGTTGYSKVRSIAFKGQLAKLLIAANIKLLSWPVISWVIKGILAKAKREKQNYADRPTAKLVAIAVCPKARGTGIAQKLVEKMESFMVSKGLTGPYTILTEKSNTRANKFYEKIGATFVKTNLHHGREINEWHKEITSARGND